MVQFCSQLEAMQNIKEQLEQRTRLIEANIQRQQDELRQIQEELHRVQGQSLQVSLSLRNVRANPERPVPPRQVGRGFVCFQAPLFTAWPDVLLFHISEGLTRCPVGFRCSCRRELKK